MTLGARGIREEHPNDEERDAERDRAICQVEFRPPAYRDKVHNEAKPDAIDQVADRSAGN